MFKQISCALVMLGASAVACADMKAHPYVTGIIGSADVDTSGAESRTSFSVLGGYYLNENFSVEGGYTDLGDEDDTDVSVVSVSMRGSYPMNESVSLYGKFGIAHASVDYSGGSESNTDLTYGVGASIRVAESVNLNVSYDNFSIGDSESVDFNVIGLGATIHF